MDIQEIVAGLGSSQALQDAAGKIGVSPDQAQGLLHGVLEHVTNPGGAAGDAAASGGAGMEGMVQALAAKVGVSPDQVQQFLPQVMPLLQGHAENASEGVQGMLGGLMGSVGGLLGAQGGDAGGGLMGLAKGLFGQKS